MKKSTHTSNCEGGGESGTNGNHCTTTIVSLGDIEVEPNNGEECVMVKARERKLIKEFAFKSENKK